MILVDILVWAVLIAFMVKGFLKGLVREACALIGLVAGGWAAFHYYPFVAEAIRPLIRLPHNIALAFSFLLIFVSLGVLFYLFGHLVTGLLKLMLLGWANRAGGVLFGFFEGAFILAILLYFGTVFPLPEKIKNAVSHSKTAQPFIASGKEIVAGWDAAHFRLSPQPKR